MPRTVLNLNLPFPLFPRWYYQGSGELVSAEQGGDYRGGGAAGSSTDLPNGRGADAARSVGARLSDAGQGGDLRSGISVVSGAVPLVWKQVPVT